MSVTPIEVFCSYANEDETWLHKLEAHLSLLKRQGLISVWHNRLIAPGTDWSHAIDDRLETASILILLVSANFFASDYCTGIEMQRALARQKVSEARVIPILVRAVDWRDAPFAHLHVLPENKKPLATWRDADAALADIATSLRHIITNELLPQQETRSRTQSATHWNIPYPRNSYFTGREEELTYLYTSLHKSNTANDGQTQAICGLGGIGKTSLAVEYAYRYRTTYTNVLWARAESQDMLDSSYMEIVQLLELPERDAQESATIIQALKSWLQNHHDYLFILDNADEPEVFMPFLPQIIGGHLLMTTRSTAVRRFHIANPLTLGVLPEDQGVRFLLQRAGLLAANTSQDHSSADDLTQAQHIYQELGGLPLALEQAGAYLEATGSSLNTYLHIYQQQRVLLLKQHQPLNYPHSVATTWAISFRTVEQKDPDAANLLRFCAFLAPDAIPEVIFTRGAQPSRATSIAITGEAYRLDQSCAILRSYSLITRDPRTQTITVHRLVQAVQHDNLDPDLQRTWAEYVIVTMNRAIPEPSIQTWHDWQLYLPHIYACYQHIETYNIISQEAGHLLNQAGLMLRHYTRYAEAEKMHERARHMYEQLQGTMHPDTATTLDHLATIYGIQDKYEQALHTYEQALLIRQQVLGSEHPDTATTINGLALLNLNWKRYEEAQKLYERALLIRQQVLGSEHPDTATTLDNLATLYRRQGNYEKAAPLFEQALHIRERVLGPEDTTTALTVHNLAVLYRRQQNYEQALPLFQRVLTIREKTLGPAHPATATALNNLAYIYRLQGAYEQALEIYERALHIREQAFGVNNPKATITCLNIGQLYHEMRSYTLAEEYIRRALLTHTQVLGDSHFNLVVILEEYVGLLYDQGRDQEARHYEQQAQTIRSKGIHSKTQ